MKKTFVKDLCQNLWRLLLVGLIVMWSTTACVDKIDESSMYTFTKDMVSTYLSKHDSLSYFWDMVQKTKLSSKSPSTLDKLLSMRGNYTCFIPTNEAVQYYVDSAMNKHVEDMNQVPDSIRDDIVKNCIIDNGDEKAYETTAFQIGSLERETMNARYLTISFDTIVGGHSAIFINTFSRIIVPDVKVANGEIHIVNRVIAPYNNTLPDLMASQDNLRIFSYLLKATGWSEKMKKYRDVDYENRYYPASITKKGWVGYVPRHHNYGYTCFVEPDSLLESEWGISLKIQGSGVTNWEEVLDKIKAICKQHYPNATSEDLTSEDNAVNQFVSYHLLDEAVPYDKIVLHYNEVGYAYTNPFQLGIDKMQYFATMGKQRRIMKITEGSQTNGKRINRYVSKYDDSNYREVTVPIAGSYIYSDNGKHDISALNGYYYPVNEVLWYSDDVVNKVLNERMRWDILSMQPELMTNGLRLVHQNMFYYIPPGYCQNEGYSDQTDNFQVEPWAVEGDLAYEGDEPLYIGQYDITFKLPPVPFSGTYEIRIMYCTGTDHGMCQPYIGTNPANLNPIGLPIDMRIRAASNKAVGWTEDGSDHDVNRENDKTLYIHGYMKCPACYGYPSKSGSQSGREGEGGIKLRQIVYRGYLDHTKVYYMRFKSVLDDTSAQFDFDTFEMVPKNIYAGADQEDIW
ncbi:MAG: fasciclin domain-containing protein [Bacteroidaceae bacterium]|jgi:uncharacterized surface protein with fasciclin (FAS1) repeats